MSETAKRTNIFGSLLIRFRLTSLAFLVCLLICVPAENVFQNTVEQWQKNKCIYPDPQYYMSANDASSSSPLLKQCDAAEKTLTKTDKEIFISALCDKVYFVSLTFCQNEILAKFVSHSLTKIAVHNALDYTLMSVCEYATMLTGDPRSTALVGNALPANFVNNCTNYCERNENIAPICKLLISGLCQYFSNVCKKDTRDQSEKKVVTPISSKNNSGPVVTTQNPNGSWTTTNNVTHVPSTNATIRQPTTTLSGTNKQNNTVPDQLYSMHRDANGSADATEKPAISNNEVTFKNLSTAQISAIPLTNNRADVVATGTITKQSGIQPSTTKQSVVSPTGSILPALNSRLVSPSQPDNQAGMEKPSKSGDQSNLAPINPQENSSPAPKQILNEKEQNLFITQPSIASHSQQNGNGPGDHQKDVNYDLPTHINAQTGHSNVNARPGNLQTENVPNSGHFFAYFLTAVVICISGYVIFHNKQKILAFIVEGRSGAEGARRRGNGGVQYKPLKSNVEEVMPSLDKATSSKNFVY